MIFLIRFFFAFLLLGATFNPTSYNYVTWARGAFDTSLSMVVLLGIILFIGYVIYLRATLRSIGVFGMFLLVALSGALIWVLIDNGLLSLENPTLNTWIGLAILSFILGTGLSWSHVRRHLSGQVDGDDISEP